MVKDITKSQLDFLSLEEVSDRAAETISGGAKATITGPEVLLPVLETEADLADPVEIPVKAAEFMETFFGLMPPLAGIGDRAPTLPDFGDIIGERDVLATVGEFVGG